MNLEKLERTVKGVRFPYCVMIAGGVVKTAPHVQRFASTEVIPEWGSIETNPSSGNGGRDYHAEYRTALNGERFLLYTQNSIGLTNPGMDHVEEYGPALIKLYADYGKPLPINVSGKSIDDTLTLIRRALACGFRVITVNGSCPNKLVNGKPGALICADTNSMAELFSRADEEFGGTDAVILWKISTGLPRALLEHNRECVRTSRVFHGIITGNTFPSTLNYDSAHRTTIKTNNGIDRGGMAGPAIHPIALDNTQFCSSLNGDGKIVVGCGGVEDSFSARKFLTLAGATLVQMHSAFREADEDPKFLRGILERLSEDL